MYLFSLFCQRVFSDIWHIYTVTNYRKNSSHSNNPFLPVKRGSWGWQKSTSAFFIFFFFEKGEDVTLLYQDTTSQCFKKKSTGQYCPPKNIASGIPQKHCSLDVALEGLILHPPPPPFLWSLLSLSGNSKTQSPEMETIQCLLRVFPRFPLYSLFAPNLYSKILTYTLTKHFTEI